MKDLLANASDVRDVHSVSGSGRSPGGGNGKPLQYSCLKNPMGRRAWQATVKRVTKSQMQLNTTERCTLQVKKKDIREHIGLGGK